MADLKYRRILLKVSGEGFCGPGGFGIEAEPLENLAAQIGELARLGVQPAVVVGAGNLVRGVTLSRNTGIHRVTGDQMGMLATAINAIALQDVLESVGISTRVLSAVSITAICEPFIRRRAIKHLECGRVVILAGGTGNPFFTTDTCAALRAAEIQAEVLIKATKVDGVYSADPEADETAQKYESLTFAEAIGRKLRIMDQSALTMCQDNQIDIVVCNLRKHGSIARIAQGERLGTLITETL